MRMAVDASMIKTDGDLDGLTEDDARGATRDSQMSSRSAPRRLPMRPKLNQNSQSESKFHQSSELLELALGEKRKELGNMKNVSAKDLKRLQDSQLALMVEDYNMLRN